MGVAKYIKDEQDGIREVVYQSGIRVKTLLHAGRSRGGRVRL